MLCTICDILNKNPPLTSLDGKWREVNCLFLSYSSSKRRGKVFGSKMGCLCFQGMRESSLMLILVLQKQMLHEMLGFSLIHKAFWYGKPQWCKEGKVYGQKVLAFEFGLVFVLWTQIGYGKTHKSLCFIMHSKIWKIVQNASRLWQNFFKICAENYSSLNMF